MTATIEAWVAAVEAYEGVPFRHMGKNRHGMDCLGLLMCAGEDIGITHQPLYEIKGYRNTPAGTVVLNNIGKFLTQRPYNRLHALRSQARRGDVIVFSIEHAASPRHMGVYLGVESDNMDYMVHADGMSKFVTKSMIDVSWIPKIHSLWYVQELEG